MTINTEVPPKTPILESKYDTGRSDSDDVTDIEVPAPTPGSAPTYVVPVFDVNTIPPGSGQPALSTVQLFRSSTVNGTYTLVGSIAFNGNPAMVTDGSLQALVSTMTVNQTFYYEADDINAAGIASGLSKPLAVLVDTVIPPTLPAPTLDPASNTGLNKSQLITNKTKPTFDATSLLPGATRPSSSSTDPAAARRRSWSAPARSTPPAPPSPPRSPTRPGPSPTASISTPWSSIDVAGNVSGFSPSIAVTINTTTPAAPTIALLASDDTGLPTHPNVTKRQRTPHFVGTAPFNANPNFPISIINFYTGAVLATGFPSANGTYLVQVTTPLPDGVYTLLAQSENQAGTYSFSGSADGHDPAHRAADHPQPLRSPRPTDTGIKGDGVTANHNPAFTGTTDKGDTVSLYVEINNQLLGPYATATASTINGAFTFHLPFNLTDGTTQLVAQTSDIAGNKGVLSSPFTVRITTTTGDYLGLGGAQLTVFDPFNETYYVRNLGAATVDATPGRDVPVQYDYNGDGSTDLAAYRYNTAEYYGSQSNGTTLDFQYGPGNASLPVSGYYGTTGTFIYGSYAPGSATWYLALPQPGGLVLHFGVPNIDIPTPAAFNGNGSTELAVFRPTTVLGGDADSYTVFGPAGAYTVSFTSAAVQSLGFVYKAGDIAAPADYDGVGRDEFAIYRPSTGQFFILNTPSDTNTATWTLRTVTMNLPGGPNASDEPVSQDYDNTGMADPTVYRPSNSTFYVYHAATKIQSNIQFGPAGQSVAAGGPILYRLTALFGTFATKGGYGTTGGGGGGSPAAIPAGGGGGLHAESIASPATVTAPKPAPASSPLATMIAVATPLPVTTTPAPVAPSASLPAARSAVTIGAATPRISGPVATASKPGTAAGHLAKSRKVSKPLTVDNGSHEAHARASTAHAKAHATTPAKAHEATSAHATAATKAKSHAKAAALAATSCSTSSWPARAARRADRRRRSEGPGHTPGPSSFRTDAGSPPHQGEDGRGRPAPIRTGSTSSRGSSASGSAARSGSSRA